MFKNNNQRLNVWLDCKNRFDYSEFLEACKIAGCEAQHIFEFAQRVGVLQCAMTLYPELEPHQAHSKFLEEHQFVMVPSLTPTPPDDGSPTPPRGCGSCGGGKVR